MSDKYAQILKALPSGVLITVNDSGGANAPCPGELVVEYQEKTDYDDAYPDEYVENVPDAKVVTRRTGTEQWFQIEVGGNQKDGVYKVNNDEGGDRSFYAELETLEVIGVEDK